MRTVCSRLGSCQDNCGDTSDRDSGTSFPCHAVTMAAPTCRKSMRLPSYFHSWFLTQALDGLVPVRAQGPGGTPGDPVPQPGLVHGDPWASAYLSVKWVWARHQLRRVAGGDPQPPEQSGSSLPYITLSIRFVRRVEMAGRAQSGRPRLSLYALYLPGSAPQRLPVQWVFSGAAEAVPLVQRRWERAPQREHEQRVDGHQIG